MVNPYRTRLALFCVLCVVLAACGAEPTPAPTPSPPRKLDVVLFPSFSAGADEALRNLVLTWGNAHNVAVTILEGMPAGQTEMLTSGQFPDCGMSWELNAWITNDVLAETTEIIAELNEYAGGYLENTLLPSRLEGKQWAVPFTLVDSVFFVRKDKLAAAGLPLPATWDDVLLIAEALTVPNEFWGWGMQIGTSGDTETAFRTKLWSYGGSVWDVNGRPAIDSDATRQVLAMMQTAWQAGLLPPDAPEWNDASNNDAYMAGRVGMVLNAGSLLYRLEEEDPELLANTAILPPPAGPAGQFSPGDIRHWVIFKTEAVDLCLDLTTWLFAPEQIRSFYEAGSGYFLPVHKDLLNDPMWQEPNRQVLAAQASKTVVTGYPGPITPWAMDARDDGVIGTMISHVLLDGWSIDEAVVAAQETLQEYAAQLPE
ncbi:MAG: extracellular solute-binding protein [Caldilineaceae bacterium]|nr:extracellular solute-binding protein [Caldilineaceae bacterium]